MTKNRLCTGSTSLMMGAKFQIRNFLDSNMRDVLTYRASLTLKDVFCGVKWCSLYYDLFLNMLNEDDFDE